LLFVWVRNPEGKRFKNVDRKIIQVLKYLEGTYNEGLQWIPSYSR
jgi:hypothetical protein